MQKKEKNPRIIPLGQKREFGEFLLATFFENEKVEKLEEVVIEPEVIKEVKEQVKTRKKSIKKDVLEEVPREVELNNVLNKFFPGDYKSEIDIDDKLVKNWFDVFSEMRNEIDDEASSVDNRNRLKKNLEHSKKLSLKIEKKIADEKHKFSISQEISWTVQLAAFSLAVFAISSIVFTSNPGMSKTALDKIGNLVGGNGNQVEQKSYTLAVNASSLKVNPEIKITKEELAEYIRRNHDSLPNGENASIIVDKRDVTGRVAGVVEIKDKKLLEKKERINQIITEGEQLIFEMLKNILNK